jgi:hypothetical protein
MEVFVPLLVLSGRVAAALTERTAEIFDVPIVEKVDPLVADLPQWREEPR